MTKKHPCPDCKSCQWCSDDRCRLCLRTDSCRKKLSMAEQIALYEKINDPDASSAADEELCCNGGSCSRLVTE